MGVLGRETVFLLLLVPFGVYEVVPSLDPSFFRLLLLLLLRHLTWLDFFFPRRSQHLISPPLRELINSHIIPKGGEVLSKYCSCFPLPGLHLFRRNATLNIFCILNYEMRQTTKFLLKSLSVQSSFFSGKTIFSFPRGSDSQRFRGKKL